MQINYKTEDEIKPNEERIYSVSFNLRSLKDWIEEEYNHLKNSNGIKGEITTWLEDLGFNVIGIKVDLTQSYELPLYYELKSMEENE